MFLTHVDTADLSQVSFYTANDTRAAFFEDPRTFDAERALPTPRRVVSSRRRSVRSVWTSSTTSN